MPSSREEFIRRLENSGIFERSQLASLAKDVPAVNTAQDGEQLATVLVSEYRITEYQAAVLLAKETGRLRLGDFLVLDKIGEGGMGLVVKSKRRGSNQVVAIKLLPHRLTEDAQAVLRFRREVELASSLQHPNIVTALEHGTEDNQLFFVMEYVDGTDVATLVKKRGSLSLLSAVDHLRDAARALNYAHELGVIHRDIKPGNLLVNRNGDAKVLDMGLARQAEKTESEHTVTDLTRSGIVLGTADYMSPEQALNAKNADNRSDIYSLGCTLYYMLAGHPPYEGETAMEKIVAHRERPIPSLRSVRDDVPNPVEQIYTRMVAKKPEERYQTAGELLRDVEACRNEFGHMWMLKRYLREQKGKTRRRGLFFDNSDSNM